jgi:hypothetical protein
VGRSPLGGVFLPVVRFSSGALSGEGLLVRRRRVVMGFLLFKGQRYDLIGFETYRKEDGEEVDQRVWKSLCPECGKAFTAWTPTVVPIEGIRRISRRCPDHKRPGRPAHKTSGAIWVEEEPELCVSEQRVNTRRRQWA